MQGDVAFYVLVWEVVLLANTAAYGKMFNVCRSNIREVIISLENLQLTGNIHIL